MVLLSVFVLMVVHGAGYDVAGRATRVYVIVVYDVAVTFCLCGCCWLWW